MDFLSLPDDIKNIIFSMFHWEALDNVRLTCRELCLFLERNYRRIDKRRLSVMCVYCHKWKPNTEIIGVKYKSRDETTNNVADDIYILRRAKRVHFTELYMYKTFLQRFDFTKLVSLQFIINAKTDVVRLFNDCFSREGCLKEVVLEYTGIPSEENISDILEFISKANNTSIICLKFAIPKPDTNEEFEYMELGETNNNSNTVGSSSARVIGNLIYHSPSVCRIELATQIRNFYSNVIECFFEMEKLSNENVCKHKSMKTLNFEDCSGSQKDIILDTFIKYNYEIVYSWSGDGKKLYLTGLKKCPICGTSDSFDLRI